MGKMVSLLEHTTASKRDPQACPSGVGFFLGSYYNKQNKQVKICSLLRGHDRRIGVEFILKEGETQIKNIFLYNSKWIVFIVMC